MTTQAISVPMDSPSSADRQSSSKTIMGTGIGNMVEWYDWNVYATFAAYFSTQLFSRDDPGSAFLQTMAVFAVGFVARPMGGYLFGWIGDRLGRKPALTLSIVFAAAGSLIIGLTPTYEQIGWLASLALVIARIVQGLAHGGELPAAQTYLVEHAPRERRGFFSSSIYVSGTIGILLGLLLGVGLQTALDEQQMQAWGWRVPFIFGGLLGVVAYWIRNSMTESEIFDEHREQVKREDEENVLVSVLKNWRQGLRVIFICAGLTTSYYIWGVMMPAIAKTSFGFDAKSAFQASIIGNLFLIVALPVWGLLSDKLGRRPLALAAVVGSAAVYYPALIYVSRGSFFALAAGISVQLVLLAAILSQLPAMFAEMFETEQRTTGFGIYYSIAIACFGGTAGYLFTWIGNPYVFGAYTVVLLCISGLVVWFMPETVGRDLSKAA